MGRNSNTKGESAPDSATLDLRDEEPSASLPPSDDTPEETPAPPPAPVEVMPKGVTAYMEISPRRGVNMRTDDPDDPAPAFVHVRSRNEKVTFVYRVNGELKACLQTQAEIACSNLRALRAGRRISV